MRRHGLITGKTRIKSGKDKKNVGQQQQKLKPKIIKTGEHS